MHIIIMYPCTKCYVNLYTTYMQLSNNMCYIYITLYVTNLCTTANWLQKLTKKIIQMLQIYLNYENQTPLKRESKKILPHLLFYHDIYF